MCSRAKSSGLWAIITLVIAQTVSGFCVHTFFHSPVPQRIHSGLRTHRNTEFHSRVAQSVGTRLSMSFLDSRIDVSPARDGSILKELIKTGNVNKDRPRKDDEVQLSWKIFHLNGTLAHSSESVADSMQKEAAERRGSAPVSTKFIFTDAETGEDIETVTTQQPGEEEEPFSFRVGAEPREVIQGWEHAVRSMLEGEVSAFEINPDMAFGAAGVPGLIDPQEALLCELTLLRIVPNPLRGYRTIEEGESITDELMAKIQSGDTPISESVMDRSPSNFRGGGDANNNANVDYNGNGSSGGGRVVDPSQVVSVPSPAAPAAGSSGEGGHGSPIGEDGGQYSRNKRRWFDPSQHGGDTVDARARIAGRGAGHSWEETAGTIDIRVPLPSPSPDPGYVAVNKGDLEVTIRHDRVGVRLRGHTLFEGVLFGRVDSAESMWAVAQAGSDSSHPEPHVQLSLEKAAGHREIWASALLPPPPPTESEGGGR